MRNTSSATVSKEKIPVAVIGASGYTGLELIRLLWNHPKVLLTAATSRQYEGKQVSKVFPHLNQIDLKFSDLRVQTIGKSAKVVFLCLPHQESMEIAKSLRDLGTKVIDLSADFRFKNTKTYEKHYCEHTQKKLAKEAVYGLCEIFGEDLRKSFLTAVPGCYVTSILLALAPLVQGQMIVLDDIICNSASGTSGAGRSAKTNLLFSEVQQNFLAYGFHDKGHRHRPEIEEKLSMLCGGQKIKIAFVPHLLPTSRGILSSIYVKPIRKWSDETLRNVYKKFYKRSPFISIMSDQQMPTLKSVVGTNRCEISLHYDQHSERLIIHSALDNLLKGASGQAVQCFNLMHGFEETLGLEKLAVFP